MKTTLICLRLQLILKTNMGVNPETPQWVGIPLPHLLKLYFKDIEDSFAKFSRKITFENDTKMITKCPRLQEIGLNF